MPIPPKQTTDTNKFALRRVCPITTDIPLPTIGLLGFSSGALAQDWRTPEID